MKTLKAATQREGMLCSLKTLEGYKIAARDGAIGQVDDFFFDDEFWMVRYLVADTGGWLPGRKVLLTPGVLRDTNEPDRTFNVVLTRKQVESSPDIDTDQPVSRQREIELHSYYDWPFYWSPGEVWPVPMTQIRPPTPPREKAADPHLRSLRDLVGYRIEASDGEIGFVDDFIANDETWAIRYLVVSTHKWIPGRKVLVSPQWLVGPISWSEKTVKVFMTKEQIQNSPEFDPRAPVNRRYETELYDYYEHPAYWSAPTTGKGKAKVAGRKKTEASNTSRRKESSSRTVHFELNSPSAHRVCVAGTFNNWHPEEGEMMESNDGVWKRDLPLEPGVYEYRLVVDGQWMPDPKADHTVENSFGERNSVLTVA